MCEQFAREEVEGLDGCFTRCLAFKGTPHGAGDALFIKTFKPGPDGLESARAEWGITTEHLAGGHPGVTQMLTLVEFNGIGYAAFRYHSCMDLYGEIEHSSSAYGEDEVETSYFQRATGYLSVGC